MKKLLLVLVLFASTKSFGQCSSLFSFGANFEIVTFVNQSSVANPHYFWNFGDGTGSNLKNPVHTFPENGNYLVTLFAKDTVSNCSSYYEYWLNVTKYAAPDSCQPGAIMDSVKNTAYGYEIKVTNSSMNCNNFQVHFDAGPGQNYTPQNTIWLSGGWQHGRFLSRLRYYTYDTTLNVMNVHRAVYKSFQYRNTSAKNYDTCSANFEFTVVSQNTNGQRILFTAMNKNAASYNWEIVGFGNPIVSTHDTISQFYPYTQNDLWLVGLHTIGTTGCKDTLYQNILPERTIQTITGIKSYDADAVNISLYPNPAHENITVNSTADIEKIAILNALGQEVQSFTNAKREKEIDITGLPSGVYFLSAKNNQGIRLFKIVKE